MARRGISAVRGLLLVALAGGLTACASVDATTTEYVGAPHFPPGDPAKVEILRREPTRPHDRLGEVMIDASTDPAPPITEIEGKLRTEAAKMGADAVVVVYDRIQPVGAWVSGPWWARSVEPVTGRRLIAVAIKYRPQ